MISIVDNLSSKDYHSIPAISNSYLSRLNKCPAAAKVKQEDSAAFAFGRAVHCYVLEGEEVFNTLFCIAPDCDKRTKEGKATLASFQEENADKEVISASDMAKLVEMKEAVFQHPYAAWLLSSGKAETSVFWQQGVTQCKCRPDWIPSHYEGIIVDLKTTGDADEYAFGRSVQNFSYARQAAFYLDGLTAASGEDYQSFVFIALEKEAPYRVEVYELDEEYINYGRAEYQRLIELDKNCKETGSYPNRKTDDLVTIRKPSYL